MTAAERNGTMTKESSALLWESLVLDTLVLECNQQNNYRTISCYTLGPEHMKYDSQDDCVLIILLTGAIDYDQGMKRPWIHLIGTENYYKLLA